MFYRGVTQWCFYWPRYYVVGIANIHKLYAMNDRRQDLSKVLLLHVKHNMMNMMHRVTTNIARRQLDPWWGPSWCGTHMSASLSISSKVMTTMSTKSMVKYLESSVRDHQQSITTCITSHLINNHVIFLRDVHNPRWAQSRLDGTNCISYRRLQSRGLWYYDSTFFTRNMVWAHAGGQCIVRDSKTWGGGC